MNTLATTSAAESENDLMHQYTRSQVCLRIKSSTQHLSNTVFPQGITFPWVEREAEPGKCRQLP